MSWEAWAGIIEVAALIGLFVYGLNNPHYPFWDGLFFNDPDDGDA